uniref:Uncharacterized protein n=1 Tax=Brassica oleracea var. oleracea TaxID=109376 RepID=A0A0D3AP16_BRAOL
MDLSVKWCIGSHLIEFEVVTLSFFSQMTASLIIDFSSHYWFLLFPVTLWVCAWILNQYEAVRLLESCGHHAYGV